MRLDMKMLLIIPQNRKSFLPLIPIGILYIGANLFKNGIEYDIIDLNFTGSASSSLIQKLEQFKPDISGISIRNIAETREMNNIYHDICDIVNITQIFSKVVLGGAGFSIFPNEIMRQTKADYGVVGAGEEAIIHIIKNLKNIPTGSIISKYNDSFMTSDISKAMQTYWDKYGKYFIINETAIPVQTTRGCKFRCRYCTYPSLSNYTIQKRPVESVLTEIKNIVEYTNRNSFYFVDSVFNMDMKYTKELLKGIIETKLNIKWGCCLNPTNYDEEMIELMKKSGCSHCEIGVDSFSDKQLINMNKGFNSNQARILLEKLGKIKLSYSISLLLGGFGETEQTLLETFNIADSFRNARINAFIGERIYPHNPLANTLSLHLKTKLYEASNDSIYIENTAIPFLESIIKNASPERWSFTGGLL